ncbi:helix-turn-helix domain-containing protein [Priestia endophytica]|uniref:Helix-turn-helix domain-containing protein n=1 Tax=Priestia endophytica DSM 13796 TaxID=1121089 RepID=A0A1I6BUZ5_9BACI|nr:helix-turn-helix transcriptional regulator [Priestia endophytica]MBG9811113.1 hypothetical protein [Priestia endophytica]SFQ84735.1 Helix-turn-helix domain-containing protein [Priestia endophytica DSM 13796]
MNIGERLKHLRELKGMSREDLSRKMNVSRQAVYKWENNKGYPDIQNLLKLSEIYETTVDELIKGNYSSTSQKEIDIDENKEDDDIWNIGFYIGMAIIFLGSFLNLFFGLWIFFIVLNIVGTLIACFSKELKRHIVRTIIDFKKSFN